ncbi:radical SAM protein [Sporomusa malonica]|uniref:Radical SAM superfamily enzyme, MoaA/NifB/PqqE/SkfB family n=1 Tax=Sporomusa malonica TaxID=112901 RepID=A0A1W2EUS9_9FIRM|nr:radical SAM protein [Sporomusa malonica]SMD13459.1 Radical SAM superfamily enzyme, MoaA/NifB/PqqE/SkfB family [Sporomusa malonica]
MTDNQAKIFAPSKVSIDNKKIETYLNGGRIYPTTVELDLTQRCTRSCAGCPYAAARKSALTLQLPFLDRLFSVLGPHTPGIVFSGGESTIVPHFPETVTLAKQKGFKEIAVISNGANIHLPEIQAALLAQVTAIRISLYDWQENDSDFFINTLKKIEGLRNLIEKSGSKLEIGASMLTRNDLTHRFNSVGQQAFAAGIHWLYFHPYCVDWDKNYPVQADQTGVLAAIEKLEEAVPKNADIHVPLERYSKEPLYFEKLHGSYFLIQIGADGINYAGPESKYANDAELLNLNDYLEDDFLWHPQRINRLNQFNSSNYRFIGTKHRPPMFSDYIQKLIQLRNNNIDGEYLTKASAKFSYPTII